MMEKRRLGNTDLKINILGLGCAPLGGNFVSLDYLQGAEIISAAKQMGIKRWPNFGPTAM